MSHSIWNSNLVRNMAHYLRHLFFMMYLQLFTVLFFRQFFLKFSELFGKFFMISWLDMIIITINIFDIVLWRPSDEIPSELTCTFARIFRVISKRAYLIYMNIYEKGFAGNENRWNFPFPFKPFKGILGMGMKIWARPFDTVHNIPQPLSLALSLLKDRKVLIWQEPRS